MSNALITRHGLPAATEPHIAANGPQKYRHSKNEWSVIATSIFAAVRAIYTVKPSGRSAAFLQLTL
ncbi:hypothetical protein QTU68_002291 [Vibrio vulnificus]|nr:hypothetical protein [Vibrio vulnificus]